MIFNMVGGGSGGIRDPFAEIIIDYPSDATVSATIGGVTITSYVDVTVPSGNNPQRIYLLPYPTSGLTQECIVTCANSSVTQTETFSDITAGTARYKKFVLELVLFNNGTLYSGLSISRTTKTAGTISISGLYLFYDIPDAVGSTGTVYFNDSLDLTNFNYITFDVYKNRGHGDYPTTVGINNGSGYTAAAPIPCSASPSVYIENVTKTINISSLTTGYLSVTLHSYNWASDIYIRKIWLH